MYRPIHRDALFYYPSNYDEFLCEPQIIKLYNSFDVCVCIFWRIIDQKEKKTKQNKQTNKPKQQNKNKNKTKKKQK